MKAKQRTKPVTDVTLGCILSAKYCLQDARTLLRDAEANNAADYVQRALKSVEGALRHARGVRGRESLPEGYRVIPGKTGKGFAFVYGDAYPYEGYTTRRAAYRAARAHARAIQH